LIQRFVSPVLARAPPAKLTVGVWKKRFGEMGVAEIRRLRQLEDENRRLKQVVADLTLDKAMLQDVVRRKW
jgi:putative transposase